MLLLDHHKQPEGTTKIIPHLCWGLCNKPLRQKARVFRHMQCQRLLDASNELLLCRF